MRMTVFPSGTRKKIFYCKFFPSPAIKKKKLQILICNLKNNNYKNIHICTKFVNNFDVYRVYLKGWSKLYGVIEHSYTSNICHKKYSQKAIGKLLNGIINCIKESVFALSSISTTDR